MRQHQSQFDRELVAAMPQLYKVAFNRCRDRADAEDLVQETVCKALQYRDRFALGTNMGAWLTTIMRHHFLSQCRRPKLFVEDPDDAIALAIAVRHDPIDRIEAREVLKAIDKLPAHFKTPLMLIADGATHKEVAAECALTERTARTRVHRARAIFVGAT